MYPPYFPNPPVVGASFTEPLFLHCDISRHVYTCLAVPAFAVFKQTIIGYHMPLTFETYLVVLPLE
ncbi:unnamed protein product [Trifolium pratense]|uniref:Uncharacterized protein n=1 Tax=Trifolium pratense TaxID=57577 RepID=A0ACB0KRL4_TRIPR|nr:unnamed protein product [Trifolium pratense]